MTFLGRLRRRFTGKTVCIMGGAPSLRDDLLGINADIWISANEHGAIVRPVDYVVSVDSVHGTSRKPLREHVRAFTESPMIGPQTDADIRIRWWPNCPERLYSGITGIYVSSEWGAKEIYLAGFSDIIGQRKQFELIRPYLKCPVYGIFNG